MKTKELSALPFLLIGFLFLLLFGIVAWGVHFDSAWVASFDLSWIERIQASVSEGKTSFYKIITEIGDVKVVIVLTIIAVIMLFFKRRYAEGLWLGGTVLFCAAIATKILKTVFDRDRPEILQLVTKTNESFPSGHAIATTIFYGLIGLVIILSTIKLWKRFIAGFIALALIGFIFITRIYLGVHFPTDVIGGFFFGMASILISMGVYLLVREPLRDLLRKMKLKDQSESFVRMRDH